MNKVILMGRLTRDPEVRYSQGATATAIARFSIAVDRRFKRDGEADADFINCVAFGKTGEFREQSSLWKDVSRPAVIPIRMDSVCTLPM